MIAGESSKHWARLCTHLSSETKLAISSISKLLEQSANTSQIEGWGKSGRNPDWNASYYVTDWLNYTSKIDAQVVKPLNGAEPLFQAGTFQGAGGVGFDITKKHWNAEFILQQGIDKTGMVKSISQHDVCISMP